MDPVHVDPPLPTWVVGGADAVVVAARAEQHRFELASLAEELRDLQAKAEVAERALAGAPTDDRGRRVPLEFAAVVDAMIAARMARLKAEIDVAHAEAEEVLATATRDVARLLLAAGVDAASLQRAESRGLDRPRPLPEPRSAAELWLEVAVGGPDVSTGRGQPLAASAADVELRTDEPFGPAGGLNDAATVYDLFWQDASHPPVSERLRRLALGAQR